MTKAELIRKLAKRSGVPDSETKIFFESFLQKTSSLLKRGEAVKINGIGYFQLRQGIIREQSGISKENILYSDLMVFFPMRNDEVYSEDSLIFNVPVPKVEGFYEVDSYFSLSIGKPVIPLEGVNDTEYFSPPSEHELKKLIETKIDKILRTSEIINKYIKGNEVLIIEPEKYRNEQFEFEWVERNEDVIPVTNPDSIVLPEDNIKGEIEHLAWDFGEDLTKQIEEEAIIDSANISEQFSEEIEEEKDLVWNFGMPVREEKDRDIPEDGYLREKEESEAAGVPGSSSNISGIEEITSENFERVKSITSFLQEQDSGDTGESADIKDAIDKTEVIDASEKLISQDKQENEEAVENPFESGDIEESRGETTVEKTDAVTSEKIAKQEKEEKSAAEEKPKKFATPVSAQRRGPGSRRNSPAVFIIALVLIIAAGIMIFFILKQSSEKSQKITGNSANNIEVPASNPTVINRNYNIPVTYPYPPKDEKSDNTPDAGQVSSVGSGAISEGGGSGNVAASNGKKTSGAGETAITSDKNNKSRPIRDYIFKSAKGYTVQVSSWQSESVARKEAKKFGNKGYISFVEKVILKNRGTWFRVKVGYFKTLLSAEQFFKKNQ